MKTKIEKIAGIWDLGYVLDKQVESSTYLGDDDNGHPQFNTIRTEVGEAVFQLKYRNDLTKVGPLADEIVKLIQVNFISVDIVIPMSPSKQRATQPVFEIAKAVASKISKKYSPDTLVKSTPTKQMKDIEAREDKVSTLEGTIRVNQNLGTGQLDVLVVDDIYASGSSLEVACSALRGYAAIRKIYVAVLSRTKP
jgi:predicted amidophosphoribosyltransferase